MKLEKQALQLQDSWSSSACKERKGDPQLTLEEQWLENCSECGTEEKC